MPPVDTDLVVDASVWIEVISGRRRWESVAEVVLGDQDLHVPGLCDIEVVSGLGKLVRRGQLGREDSAAALRQYLAFPIQRHDHEWLLPEVLELRDRFTAYDATYVVLATGLNASLATLDRRLARAAREHLGLATVGA